MRKQCVVVSRCIGVGRVVGIGNTHIAALIMDTIEAAAGDVSDRTRVTNSGRDADAREGEADG